EITRTVTSADPTAVKSQTDRFRFNRVALRYEKRVKDGPTVFVTPSIGRDVDSTEQRFGATPTALSRSSTLLGLRAGWRGKVTDFATAQAGFDVEGSFSDLSRSGSVTSPPREGDVHAFGQAPPDRVNADHWSTTILSLAPYGFIDVTAFGERLH